MSDNLIVELNNIKYLLVEMPVTPPTREKVKTLCKKYDCIAQGIKEIKQEGFWSGGYIIMRILVPETNVIAFNNES